MRQKPGNYQKAAKLIKSEQVRCSSWPIVGTQSILAEQVNVASKVILESLACWLQPCHAAQTPSPQ